MSKIVYASNGAAIGDGVRITRVSEDGQKLEVMVDAKTERYSEVILEPQPESEPDPEPVHQPAPSLSAFSVGPQDGTDLPIEVSVDDDRSKPIDFYVVGISAGGTAPSAAQVKAGTDATDTAATVAASWTVNVDGSTTTTETVTDIPADTYDFYIVAEDSAGNLTATPLTDLGMTYGVTYA